MNALANIVVWRSVPGKKTQGASNLVLGIKLMGLENPRQHSSFGFFLILALTLPTSSVLSQNSTTSRFEQVLRREQPGHMFQKTGVVRFKSVSGIETNATLPQPVDFDEFLRTLEESWAVMRISGQSQLKMHELTRLEIVRRSTATNAPMIYLREGRIRATDRGGSFVVPIKAPGGNGTPKGTEFEVSVDAQTGMTMFNMFDGEVEITNEVSRLFVKSGEQGIAEPGKPIRKEPLQGKNIVQWWIYYPAVLDVNELPFTPAARTNLAASLTAYHSGSLVQALERFPGYPQRQAGGTDTERAYLASLLLSVGAVDKAQRHLALADSNAPPIRAIQIMINAVTQDFSSNKDSKAHGPKRFDPSESSTASESLALSYRYQAEHNLKAALDAARDSVRRSPNFGFGWARVAELEFSFGHISAAARDVKYALELTASNAPARTVNGFLLAAENHVKEAINQFDEAILLDPALGDAWLGRALCKIRLATSLFGFGLRIPHSAHKDLEAAAALEPNRSLLRSYAGKAFTEAGDTFLAEKELNFARELDRNDPTPYLYAALFKQQENRINEAIADLEASQQLNDNRGLFRSRSLLDEDRAVRSANLALIYRDAGMTEVAIREAARAVTYDYANYSTHLFLSDSYNQLRDPTRFNLRYQTVWLNELLLANLLSPVGAGRLSQHVSQQEYSRLFEGNNFGIANSTLARTDGRLQQLASQFGTFGRTSYALDLDYEHNDGVRPNNDLESIEWYSTIKQQFTPQDTALLLFKYQDYSSGDNFQHYDPADASRHFRFDEYQHPIALGGWHHEWGPGIHTLFLGGRLENSQHFTAPDVDTIYLVDKQAPAPNYANPDFGVKYRGDLEIYTAELNQVFEWDRLTICAGTRYQGGMFQTHVILTNPVGNPFFTNPFETNRIKSEFERITGYAYLTIEPFDRVWLTGGFAYDDITFPSNFRHPPLSEGEDHRSLFGPKIGLVYEVDPHVTLRGLFAKSLGGVSLDDSYRLEPTQIAGFPQAFRNLIPESVVGSVAAPEYRTYGGALDFKFGASTYAGLQLERLEADVRQTIGYFLFDNLDSYDPSSMPENLYYRETSLMASVNQLFGEHFAAGVNYKFSKAAFTDSFPELPAANRDEEARLHQFSGYVLFNSRSGFFARAESHWYQQQNLGYSQPIPGDHFWQHNLFAGYRLAHRRVELLLGILNLTDQDYHLNPLNVYSELPRERTLMARLNFQF